MNVKQIFGKHYCRLLTHGILKSVFAGVGVGFLVGGIFSLLYWMLGFGAVWLGAVTGLCGGVAFGIATYLLRYRLTDRAAAGRLDRYGLEERIITMLELNDDGSEIARLQRRDALESLAALPAESIKFKVSPLFASVISVTVTVSLFFGMLGLFAHFGKIPYGRDLMSQGADGSFEVRYTVDGGGYIRGRQSQSARLGASTEPVRAIAEDGWMFVGWSDGEKSPERCENNVDSDITVKAVFEKIDSISPDEEDSDSADDLPYGSVIEEGGGGSSDQIGGDNVKDDGDGNGGGKWQDRNQFIDGATYYRDYLEFYYQYATGIFDSETDIPEEVIEFFEMYFNGI